MPETMPLPAVARRRWFTPSPAAALREETERLYPYGPPPPLVDPAKWTELTEAVYAGQFVLGLDLPLHQVRDLAAIIADRVLVEDSREAVSAPLTNSTSSSRVSRVAPTAGTASTASSTTTLFTCSLTSDTRAWSALSRHCWRRLLPGSPPRRKRGSRE